MLEADWLPCAAAAAVGLHISRLQTLQALSLCCKALLQHADKRIAIFD